MSVGACVQASFVEQLYKTGMVDEGEKDTLEDVIERQLRRLGRIGPQWRVPLVVEVRAPLLWGFLPLLVGGVPLVVGGASPWVVEVHEQQHAHEVLISQLMALLKLSHYTCLRMSHWSGTLKAWLLDSRRVTAWTSSCAGNLTSVSAVHKPYHGHF